MQKPKVCLDFNGVLADPITAICEHVRTHAGIVVPAGSFSKESSLGKNFPNATRGGRQKCLTPEIYDAAKRAIFDTDEFLSIPAIPGAASATHTLLSSGFDLLVVSDARSVSKERVTEWLRRREFPNLDVVLTHRRRPKEPYQRRCDFAIDNEVGNLFPMRNDDVHLVHFLPPEGAAGSVLIATTSDDARIPSLRGWPEVLSFILKLDAAEAA